MAAVIMLPSSSSSVPVPNRKHECRFLSTSQTGRETSIAIAMLPEQALKIRHRGLLRDERTEETRMLQGLAEANQVDLYLTHAHDRHDDQAG